MHFNRRDLGYSIISRFESILRESIATTIVNSTSDYLTSIPTGILEKAKNKNNNEDFEGLNDLLECTDFPDLAEICCFANNYPLFFRKLNKNEFSISMGVLYGLRCKIAHIKGFFTSIDLDKLIDLSTLILSETTSFKAFKNLLENLQKFPDKFVQTIPLDFNIDFLENNGILNNLPIPDYEYEGGFVGREDDIKKINNYLEGDKFPVITITGAGGVGKTSLALKVIQELTQNPNFNKFDAIIWLSAKENKLTHLGIEDIEPTIKSYEELLDTIITVLQFDIGETIAKKEEIVNTIFEMSKGILIIVDNLETIADERIINFIIDSPKTAKFLITSRKGLGQVERRHELKQLKEKEAVYLFRQTARDKQLNSLMALDDKLVKKYVNKVSCFPLAIKWVIGLVARGKDINKVIASINDATGDISKFCFSAIFADLSSNCKQILYSICCFDNPPTDGVLKYVVDIEEDEFEDGIEELIIVSLIIPEQYKNEQDEIAVKYSIIPLTKGYIRQQLSKEILLKEQIESKIAATQSTLADTEKAKREYRYSLNNLGAITEEEKVAAILVQSALQKYEAGLYEDAVDNYKSAMGIAPRFSTIYRNWAVMESREGHWDEANALMEKAKDLNPKDPQIWLLWGNIHKSASKYTDAHEKYETANKIAPTDHIILNAFAQIKNRLGQYEIANDLFGTALEIGLKQSSTKHEIINRSSLAENLLNWGDYLYKDRNFPLTEKKLFLALEQCLKLMEIDSRDNQSISLLAQCYFKLGLYYKRMGDKPKAIGYFKNLLRSSTMSNKEDYYVVNGTMEYVGLCMKEGNNYLTLIDLLTPLQKRFSSVFQKRSEILERYKFIINELENTKTIDVQDRNSNSEVYLGKVITINDEKNFVIIDCDGNTFLGMGQKFIPPLKTVDILPKFTLVKFNTYLRNKKLYAENIIIIK
jgi:LuxR family glucitol operon transcriptional activator